MSPARFKNWRKQSPDASLGLVVFGTYSSAFRSFTAEKDDEVVEMIQRAGLHVWAGVGAAFVINTGRKKQAPRWMRECSLKWLFRLAQEPRRLSRRYLVHDPATAPGLGAVI